MNTYYYADFPALLALLSHLPDDIFQHEFIDERLRWRNGELTKFCPVCPIPKANKGSFAAQTGCRERGARRVAQGLSRMVAPVARDALVRLRAHLWGSRTVCARVSYACPMPVYVDVPAGLIWLHLVLIPSHRKCRQGPGTDASPGAERPNLGLGTGRSARTGRDLGTEVPV